MKNYLISAIVGISAFILSWALTTPPPQIDQRASAGIIRPKHFVEVRHEVVFILGFNGTSRTLMSKPQHFTSGPIELRTSRDLLIERDDRLFVSKSLKVINDDRQQVFTVSCDPYMVQETGVESVMFSIDDIAVTWSCSVLDRPANMSRTYL